MNTNTSNFSDISAPLLFFTLLLICILAFTVRIFSIVQWESVIHEYDPYFNYRTAKYLTYGGFYNFLNWFDNRSWYPLGRVVGGTVYPGIMLTTDFIQSILHLLGITINIRNMCVFIGPIFASFTCMATYLLVKESTKQSNTALLASAFISIVPSYISRSVGGSYDYESVAIFALIITFYFWVKSVNTGSMLHSLLCTLCYLYMVSSWGGYIFIINIIPIYVVIMIVVGRYSDRLYIAYSIFYAVGSLFAMQVPFVGFNVVLQAECAASHGVFLFLQCYKLCRYIYQNISGKIFKYLLWFIFIATITAIAGLLLYLQYTKKMQWTGRSLTLLDPTYAKKYIPIIASVSEHQSTPWTSFMFDLHILVLLSPFGLYYLYNNITDGSIFLILYGTLSWYFAGTMVRLLLTLAPIACMLGAVGFSAIFRHFFSIYNYHNKKYKYSFFNVLIIISSFLFLLVCYGFHSVLVASEAYSSPSIVLSSSTRDGGRVILDDYREAYYWMRMNTDINAKFMSWWDYGYQMAGMGNRTVIVDNNTWNNTHIATVGRAMSTTEIDAYPIIRSLDVDYVLVVFGGVTAYSGDDINKFLWMIRIGAGVYPDSIKEENFFANGQYRIDEGGTQTMKTSLLYKLSYYRFSEKPTNGQYQEGFDNARRSPVGVKNIHLRYFEEAFTSQNWIIRIYKVKKQEPFVHTDILESKLVSWTNNVQTEKTTLPRHEFIGCYASESSFSSDKIYGGGFDGVSLESSLSFAKSHGKKYVAIARLYNDGHIFAFSKIGKRIDGDNGNGCERVCSDISEYCGCADSYCNEPLLPGESNNRRWAVYSL